MNQENEAFDTSLNVFWSKTYNTSLLNNDITNQELKDKFKKLLKEFGIYKNKSKVKDSVLKTLSSLRPYKEENEKNKVKREKKWNLVKNKPKQLIY
ncbi:hypothetical protein CIB43_00709 [Mesomycoplasma hyopneumoniae]|uniref:Uncharacterized protein n=1 Tax=Mesomycoplasma hyopneumoniae TaxID=2099 RepID=A0A223MAM6_MESHO|nr:hypothetical protein CIB43_00709 [Mesomycoplasma hyopneumoniae]